MLLFWLVRVAYFFEKILPIFLFCNMTYSTNNITEAFVFQTIDCWFDIYFFSTTNNDFCAFDRQFFGNSETNSGTEKLTQDRIKALNCLKSNMRNNDFYPSVEAVTTATFPLNFPILIRLIVAQSWKNKSTLRSFGWKQNIKRKVQNRGIFSLSWIYN